MSTERELEEKFWKALKSARTIMLGLRRGDYKDKVADVNLGTRH